MPHDDKSRGTPRHKPHDPERLRRHVPWATQALDARRGKPPAPPPSSADPGDVDTLEEEIPPS